MVAASCLSEIPLPVANFRKVFSVSGHVLSMAAQRVLEELCRSIPDRFQPRYAPHGIKRKLESVYLVQEAISNGVVVVPSSL